MTNFLVNPEDVHPAVADELEDVIDRAVQAGAEPPLTYLGAGMTAVVLCDAANAFKVGRRPDSPTLFRCLEAEAEMMALAAEQPELRDRIAEIRGWDPRGVVIVKECVEGRPGVWGEGSFLYPIHDEILSVLEELDWGGIEYKEDSYVIAPGRGPVLVDGGCPIRFGRRLADYVRGALNGTRYYPEDPRDLCYALRIEAQEGRLPEDEAEGLIEALREADWGDRPCV